jgi:hypothetical protein
MNCTNRTSLALKTIFLGAFLHLALTSAAQAQTNVPIKGDATTPWTAPAAEHVYGFPEIKPGKDGTLTLSADALTFTSKSSNSSIPRDKILAVSNGSDRVELWGTTGQIVRMVIPDGGGLAAGAVLHHRVGMLTVDFVDVRGGKHSAVFNMPPAQADAGLAKFSQTPVAAQPPAVANACADVAANPGSVLVAAPNWQHAQVPAAYRALVYEHVINRLQGVKGVSHVYRDGEVPLDGSCPAYTVRISVQTFKQGNQIARASLGPAGMFVGTTQVAFDYNITDASGDLNQSEQVKAAIRMQSESTGVADKFAKTLAKHYVASLKTEDAAVEHARTAGQNSFR